MKMEAADYTDMVATPEAHLDFLRHTSKLAEAIPEGQDAARKLNTALRESIEVAGQPFSQPRHLVQLERYSDAWDLEETAPQVLREIVQLSDQIKAFDESFDLPHFTTSYEYIRSLVGDAEPSPPR